MRRPGSPSIRTRSSWLRRASELFGIDLDHPDDRLSCWLQPRIAR
jgi:DNA-binding PucR family transcriptional regulator